MKVVKTYDTKARWKLRVLSSGNPYTGYEGAGTFHQCLDQGQNVLVYGALFLHGVSRGRSATHLDAQNVFGEPFHFSAQGIFQLFQAIADERVKIYPGNTKSCTVPTTKRKRAYGLVGIGPW